MSEITQAFVLAAGEGKRMQPLTTKIPKPLAMVNGLPIIDHIIKKISTIPQISKIVINSFYLQNILESHLQSLNNPRIIISSEKEKLETGGGLVNALPLFNKNEPILIINGDLFWIDQENSLIRKIISSFDAKKMDILLALKEKEKFIGYEGNGDFDINNGNLIKANKAKYTYIGIQILHPRILHKKPQEKCFSLNHFFNTDLVRIKSLVIKEEVFHIGTLKMLNYINSRDC